MLTAPSPLAGSVPGLSLLLALGCNDCTRAVEEPCREPQRVTVTRVIDGDTFVVDPPIEMPDGTTKTDVRPICLQAPEDGACYHDHSLKALRERIEGETVRLTFGDECVGIHRRALAYVWLDGTLLNVEMAREGYAGLIAPPFDDNACCEDVQAAMEAAAEEGLGGWSICSGQVPFEL
jgi:micrococcal nuclease